MADRKLVAAIVGPMVTRPTSAPEGRLTIREIVILLLTVSIVATAAVLLVLSTSSTVAALG